jgi:glucose/arabinose dehydrogenase
VSGAVKSIWSYGHRNPQGLEFNDLTGELWSSEHGPRGGDEINLILPGRNYGWPLYSLGVNYDGTPVGGGEKKRGIKFDLKDIVQPVVDLTPSPAVSNFIFYHGDRFPQWQGNMIVGTLKANKLYRIVLKDKKLVHKEILLKSIGRVRDVKEGGDGSIYLLIEHGSGGKILKLIPA